MDWLTFIAKIVEAIAWPAVVVGVLLLLRKEFPVIIHSLRKLKFKDVELEFAESAKVLAAETKRAVPISQDDDFTILGQSLNAITNRLTELADISPRAAILESWLLVEVAAAEFLRHVQKKSSNSYPSALRLLDGLLSAGVLTAPQEAAFQHLRRLRNDAVHTPEADFTSAAVSDYIEAALAMAGYLDDMAQMEINSN